VVQEPSSEDILSAAQDAWAVGQVLVAWPTVPALELLLSSYGFEIESMYDWKSRLAGRPPIPGLKNYAQGRRATLRCRSREAAIAAGAEPVAPLPVDAGPAPRARRHEPTPPALPAEPAGGWRERVNKTLAKATGYELRRVSAKR
jgi:hypothetical protein